jgi:hypothetical protein
MQLVTIPLKMPTVWGINAASGFRRQPPNASLIGQVNGAASYSDGFVPLNFTPVAAGGVPPFGQDMNGVLFQMTGWDRWFQAGGIIRYDAQFQQAIGGYPSQARIGSLTTPFLVWQSTVDNNLTNPDTGGAGWQTPLFPDPSVAGGSVLSALTIAAALGANSLGANLAFVGNGNIAPRKWLRAFNGNLAVVNNAYNAEIFTLSDAGDISNVRNVTAAGEIAVGGGLYAGTFFSPNAYNGYEWQFTINPDGGKVQAYRAGGWYDLWNASNGARSWNAPSGALMVLDGVGNLSTFGSLTSNYARLTYGARGSGDPDRAVTLGDYASGNGYQELPNGLIFQWGNYSEPNPFLNRRVPYTIPFPTAALVCVGGSGAAQTTSGAPDQWANVNADNDRTSFAATAGTIPGTGTCVIWWFAVGY